MIYFLDTEFIEDGKTIDLISLALVRETGETLYLQNSECDFSKASDWVWRNVFPHLLHFNMCGKRLCHPTKESYDSGLATRTHSACNALHLTPDDFCPWATRYEIRDKVTNFCDPIKHGKPSFWGYYADYDWVTFCQLFGTMIELPKGYPMFCNDIKQWADQLGDIRLPQPEKDIHHALNDALQVKEWYEHLSEIAKK